MTEAIWDIEYNPEARNYLYDSYPYTEDVLIAIEGLRFLKEAIPPEGLHQLEPGVYMWQVLQHVVVYQRRIDAKPKPMLWILVVKPLE
jgi:hypothetical protein